MSMPEPTEYWDLVTRLEHFDIQETPGLSDNVVVLIRMTDDGLGPYYTMQKQEDDAIVTPRVVDAILRRFKIDGDDWRRSVLLGPKEEI